MATKSEKSRYPVAPPPPYDPPFTGRCYWCGETRLIVEVVPGRAGTPDRNTCTECREEMI